MEFFHSVNYDLITSLAHKSSLTDEFDCNSSCIYTQKKIHSQFVCMFLTEFGILQENTSKEQRCLFL